MTWQKKWTTLDDVEAIVDDVIKVGSEFPDNDKIKEIITRREIVGDLALDFTDEGWNIYHVPTGACFDKAVPPNSDQWEPEFNYDKDQLLNWMKKVQENYPSSWQMLRQLTPEDFADKGQSAKDILLKWCLSVKVE